MNLPTDFTETTDARRPFASGRDGMAGPDPMDDQPPRDHRRSLLIADDDALVLYRLLRSEMLDSFRIVAVAQNATDAIALAEQHQPDAALIDVEMPGGGARAAVPAIALCSPNTRMVILLADEIHHVVVELLAAGAMAFVRKGVGGDRMAGTLAQALLVEV